jgi:hypothetical protein
MMQHNPSATEPLSLLIYHYPSFNTGNIICSSSIKISTGNKKWSYAITALGFTGTSFLYSDPIEDTFASIDSFAIIGRVGYKFSQSFESVHFLDNEAGPFARKIPIDADSIRWSHCDDTIMIQLDASMMIQSLYAGRSIAIDVQEVFLSFRQCY